MVKKGVKIKESEATVPKVDMPRWFNKSEQLEETYEI